MAHKIDKNCLAGYVVLFLLSLKPILLRRCCLSRIKSTSK
jgi:hypothetical protein